MCRVQPRPSHVNLTTSLLHDGSDVQYAMFKPKLDKGLCQLPETSLWRGTPDRYASIVSSMYRDSARCLAFARLMRALARTWAPLCRSASDSAGELAVARHVVYNSTP